MHLVRNHWALTPMLNTGKVILRLLFKHTGLTTKTADVTQASKAVPVTSASLSFPASQRQELKTHERNSKSTN